MEEPVLLAHKKCHFKELTACELCGKKLSKKRFVYISHLQFLVILFTENNWPTKEISNDEIVREGFPHVHYLTGTLPYMVVKTFTCAYQLVAWLWHTAFVRKR